MRVSVLASVAVLVTTLPAAAQPQGQAQPSGQANGAAVFDRACASCHQPGQTATLTPQLLRAFSPEAIVNSLVNGKMAVQGAELSDAERRAVAVFLTGRALAETRPPADDAVVNRCAAATPTSGPSGAPSWMAWGNDATQSRFAPQGGLTAADLPKLTLKWAFGYDGATASRIQPAMAGGMLFVASDNAELHALDPATGCTYWTFVAESGVRSALTVGPYTSQGRSGLAVFFGDQRANAYAVDSVTGHVIWTRKLDEHPAAAITGALTLEDGKVFVPTQGLNEEGTGARGGGPCCTFRGSLSALDAGTGAVLWKTHMVDEPRLRGRNTRSGADAFGPAGGAIWSAPTADLARRAVYVSTGNAYADPPQSMTNAVVGMDMDTGAVRWVFQATPNDVWLGGCGPRNPDNPGCPEVMGPDYDFSAAPMLVTTNGRQLLLVPQKSGIVHALDPDERGAVVWQSRISQGSGLGGQWGGATDGQKAYFGVGDYQTQNPGGVRALDMATGQQIWSADPPQPRLCAELPRCNPSQGGAVTVIPGAVLAGSLDGGVRAYSTDDGRLLWQFDTNREFTTVNGVKATGASIDGSPMIVGGGMLYVNSGYGGIAARPGNVLLAFAIE